MRNIILFLVVLISFNFSYSQMKVRNLESGKSVGKVYAGLGLIVAELDSYKDGSHILRYRDSKYSHISSYKSFKLAPYDSVDMYNILNDAFNDMPKEVISMEFEDDVVYAHFKKSLGVIYVYFIHIEKNSMISGSTNNFNRLQIDRLFGKNLK